MSAPEWVKPPFNFGVSIPIPVEYADTPHLNWIVRKRPGPRTKPAQDKIAKRLKEIGPAPPGMSVVEQAKRLGVSKRTLERYRAHQILICGASTFHRTNVDASIAGK